MSDETTLADTTGRIARIVDNGHKRNDLEWQKCRLLLSSKQLIIATNEGKRRIDLETITAVKSRSGLSGSGGNAYLSVQVGTDVDVIAPTDDDFGDTLYSAVLDQRTVLVKHPAVKGGVVQDTDWERGRIKLGDGTVDLAITSGSFVEVETADVGTVDRAQRQVAGDERDVIEVEHTVDGTSVETHVSGARRDANILFAYLSRETVSESDVDLSTDEQAVLMALYTGVSPFEIPDFVDMDVDHVEEIYERLIEAGLLTEVRTRRAVSLQPRGRNIAGEEMADQ